jgi:phage baseplate assembly protein W
MGLGVSLPITLNSKDGFTVLYGIRETLRQNFIMLLMTNPGERVMEPEFGVGIKTFLFTNKTENYRASIIAKVNQQVKKYIPAIVVNSIDFAELAQDRNSLSMRIEYFIPDMNIKELLELTI